MKFNSFRCFLLFLAFFSITPIFAQENFVPGYILKLNGDTLKGFVDYRNWAKSPDKIRFKLVQTTDVVRYKPVDIMGFGVKDEIYKSAVVKVENSNNTEVSSTPIFSFRTDTAFLQTLFQGPKSLYYYKDRFDKDNFYILNGFDYELLEYKKYLKKDADQHEFFVENKRYIGQILFYLQDCQGIDVKMHNVRYTDKSLQNIFEYYYNQKQTETLVKRANEKIQIEFGVSAGPSLVDLKFRASNNSSFYYLTNLNFESKLNFAGGSFLNIVFPRNNGKWSMYNELTFCSDISDYVFKSYYQSGYFEYHSIDIGGYYIKMNNMLRYKYPISKMFIFANFGFSNGFVIAETNKVVGVDKYNDQPEIIEKKLLDDTRKYDLGAIFGIGVKHKRYSLEFRLESGSGLSPYLGLSSNTCHSSLLLGYQF